MAADGASTPLHVNFRRIFEDAPDPYVVLAPNPPD